MTEPLTVVFELRAAREIEDIDAWWRTNRPTAPLLFLTELERMLGILVLMPSVGAPAKSERLRDLRRVRLRRTRYHVYYRVRGENLEVLAVWHEAREAGPGL